MGYVLQKFVSLFLQPYTAGMIALAIGLCLRARGGRPTLLREGDAKDRTLVRGRFRLLSFPGRDAFWLWGGFLWMLLWSIPAIPNWMLFKMESPYPVVPVESQPLADAIVVLGGAIGPPSPPERPYPVLHDAADRYWHAVRLYRAGRAPVILVSAGHGEAPYGAMFLRELGVPESAILSEAESRTTAGNAFHTRRLLSGSERNRILLVTSADHMRRALPAFEREGFEVIPAAIDHHASLRRQAGQWGWFPDAGALCGSAMGLREYAGSLAYWLGLGAR